MGYLAGIFLSLLKHYTGDCQNPGILIFFLRGGGGGVGGGGAAGRVL